MSLIEDQNNKQGERESLGVVKPSVFTKHVQ